MAIAYNPRIVTDGLVLSLDAGNLKGYDKYENLALNSEAINIWNNNGNAISVSANSQIAPDGTLTADVLSQTAVTGASRWVSSIERTYTAGVTYTLSIWLKKISGTDAQPSIDLWINGVPQQSVGTITTEWVRYSKSFTPASTISLNTFTGLNIGWNNNGVANNFTFAAWGFQVEVGSTATDYYPTTSTTKTRGSTLIDLSGNGNTGTLTNGPTYSSANGGSIVFGGSNNYVILSSNFINNNLPNFTISSWFNKTSNGILFGNHYHNSTWEAVWFSTTSFIVNAANNSTTNRQTLSYADPSNNTWHNLVAVNNSTLGFMKVFLNGVEYASLNATVIPWNSTVSPTMGAQRDISTGGVQGQLGGSISQTQVYNRALTAAEIQQNYNALRGRFGI